MKIWDNNKGLASVLSIVFLMALSGGLGAGIWVFSKAEIVSFEGEIAVAITKEAQSLTVAELANDPAQYFGQRVEVAGNIASQEERCIIEEAEAQFFVSCWAPLTEPSAVETNVNLEPTKTMDFYFDQEWSLIGKVKIMDDEYYLAVESYYRVEQ